MVGLDFARPAMIRIGNRGAAQRPGDALATVKVDSRRREMGSAGNGTRKPALAARVAGDRAPGVGAAAVAASPDGADWMPAGFAVEPGLGGGPIPA
jgi:hypothetical protein